MINNLNRVRLLLSLIGIDEKLSLADVDDNIYVYT